MLRAAGYDCTHVGDIGMWRATDSEILAWALQHNSTVVTLDADFHAMLAVTCASGPSVIRLRMQGLSATEVVKLVRMVIARFEADLQHGCLVTVKARKITCHRLPVGSLT